MPVLSLGAIRVIEVVPTMLVGLRFGIVGGSIGGAATAAALLRDGHSVAILERSGGALRERGAGIGLPPSLTQRLKAEGLMDASAQGMRPPIRTIRVRDGEAYLGRILKVLPYAIETFHWGLIYEQLMAHVDPHAIRFGAAVEYVEQDDEGVDVRLSDGTRERFDVVVGADGYNSVVRHAVMDSAVPTYAGYPAWRGVLHETEVFDGEPVEDNAQQVLSDNGHAILLWVPGVNGERTRGQRRLNWLWYDVGVPADLLEFVVTAGSSQVKAVAPGAMTVAQTEYLHRIARKQLPPWHARIIRDTKQPYLSPLYDLEPERYARGRVCLVGDAAAVVRPHAAAGATKAIEDALALAESFSSSSSIGDAMQRYAAARLAVGKQIVELSRRLGVQQVSSCPVWREMDEQTFDDWWQREEMDRTYFTPDRVGDGDKWSGASI